MKENNNSQSHIKNLKKQVKNIINILNYRKDFIMPQIY